MIQLTENEIADLLAEQKVLPPNYSDQLQQLRPKRGHSERMLSVTGTEGHTFLIILRQSKFNHLDFSAILGLRLPQSNQIFHLRRYNGKHGEHTNKIEQESFYDFHVHMATERYQDIGMREDAYAEPSDCFTDLAGALQCLLTDCGFELPPDPQGRLFPGFV